MNSFKLKKNHSGKRGNKRIQKEERKVGIVQARDVEVGKRGKSHFRAICFAERIGSQNCSGAGCGE